MIMMINYLLITLTLGDAPTEGFWAVRGLFTGNHKVMSIVSLFKWPPSPSTMTCVITNSWCNGNELKGCVGGLQQLLFRCLEAFKCMKTLPTDKPLLLTWNWFFINHWTTYFQGSKQNFSPNGKYMLSGITTKQSPVGSCGEACPTTKAVRCGRHLRHVIASCSKQARYYSARDCVCDC